MKFYKHLPSFLNATFLLMPLQLVAAEKNAVVVTETTAALNTTTLSTDPMSGGYLMQLVVGLFVVLICIVALAWLAKKMNRFHSLTGDTLKVIGGLSMSSRERIVLLQVGEEQLLLGVSPGRINTLHVLDKPVDVTGKQVDGETGSSFLEKFKDSMAAANNNSLKKSNSKPK